MNILKALKAFAKGKRIYRLGWDHNQTLGFETSQRFVGGLPAGAYMSCTSGCVELYTWTIADLMAEDWVVCKGATR